MVVLSPTSPSSLSSRHIEDYLLKESITSIHKFGSFHPVIVTRSENDIPQNGHIMAGAAAEYKEMPYGVAEREPFPGIKNDS